jgi:anaerobic magnesium-protoporphyrin IX monomethyl ester cyclase
VIYGGVFPTYHWRDILEAQPEFDIIVRGEGEETCRQLLAAIAASLPLTDVKGIACRVGGKPHGSPPREMIDNLDA